MTDLKIDFDTLHDSSKSLGDIDDAFDKLKSRTSATDSDWGSSNIRGAMHDFSDNWDSHRHKIMKSVESVKKMVDEALKGFTDTDDKLKNSLHQSTSHGSAAH